MKNPRSEVSARLSSLWLYPVKGLRGHPVDEAEVTPRGLAGDRRCMVVDDDGSFLTQRRHPTMVRTRARWDARDGTVTLTHGSEALPIDPRAHGDRRTVRVWASTVEARELAEGSRFLSSVLGLRCHLVVLPESETRPVTSRSGREGDEVSFADAFPFLLTSTTSLDDLVARAGTPLAMERFRPNLVASGLAPWAEDAIARLTIGALRFEVRKACERCSVTTVDPETGAVGKEPLKTLATFRERDGLVWFGVDLVARDRGKLVVGDPITAFHAA